jgi:hypothetical protein
MRNPINRTRPSPNSPTNHRRPWPNSNRCLKRTTRSNLRSAAGP